MKILITGIHGFAGTYLAKELRRDGYDVWGIDKASKDHTTLAIDICDSKSLTTGLQIINPDFVAHLAGIAHVEDTSLMYDINTGGTRNLLNACLHLSHLPRLLFISSSLIYGNVAQENQPIDEKFPVNPVNHYGDSKARAEREVNAFSEKYNLEYVIARPFNHTGPGQRIEFVIPKIIAAFKQRKPSIDLGNTHAIRDFSDVRDVVGAYKLIIENFKNGETYNIASGKGYSISELVEETIKLAGHHMQITQAEYLMRTDEIEVLVGNASKIRRELGWEPKYGMAETLRSMLEA
ncbi:MAG: GDP-mannose 4,6-dehydratase [Bacteroidales bacterium]|nr:GDP-mannose 4,6-dehydratase [Bacteroidales bacterium]MDZ4205023.1 GDP-mannose 4,6-dehydratase [Bacteroidales bacterium]